MNILLYIAITCLLCISSFLEGERTSYERYALELQEVKTDHAKSMAIAEAHGKRIEAGLLAEVEENERHRLEKKNAIAKSTTDAACLNADTVRLLHDAAPSIVELPEAPIVAADADAAATHDASNGDAPVTPYTPDASLVITDRAVALWVLDMDALYYECRIRLDALIQWHEGVDK